MRKKRDPLWISYYYIVTLKMIVRRLQRVTAILLSQKKCACSPAIQIEHCQYWFWMADNPKGDEVALFQNFMQAACFALPPVYKFHLVQVKLRTGILELFTLT